MGCDIHLYAEKKVYSYEDKSKNKGQWISIDKWVQNEDKVMEGKDGEGMNDLKIHHKDRFYSGRNYNLFCALAGVRSYMFNDEAPIISDPKGLPEDVSILVKKESDSWKGDGHTHSYLTLSELMFFDWSSYGDTCSGFLSKVLPKLQEFKTDPEEIRIVFFFDN